MPDRRDLAHLLTGLLQTEIPQAAGRAAWQGALSALPTWVDSTGPADLDIWADDTAADIIDAALRALPAARVAHTTDPRRLRHTSYAVETADGLAVIDVTRGDLRVGPVLLCAQTNVETDLIDGSPRLAGGAAVADLLIRKLLRGSVPDTARLQQARQAWGQLDRTTQDEWLARWSPELGKPLVRGIAATLRGAGEVAPALARAARQRLARQSLAPANLGATWAARRTVLPAAGHAGPLGLRISGTLVVIVGTDGSGKSTVADELSDRLRRAGFDVTGAYLGMARGNLPGVSLARKLLGVAPAGDGQGPGPTSDQPASDPAVTDPADRSTLDHAGIRKAAAWYYAGEYGWKWARQIAPGLRRRAVVVCDRYVYDLRESPWPGSPAAGAAQSLLSTPDVFVLPDAPDDVIHERKPERPAAEQADQQQRFRQLLDSAPARYANLRVDTSGNTPDPVAAVVAAVVEAAHLRGQP